MKLLDAKTFSGALHEDLDKEVVAVADASRSYPIDHYVKKIATNSIVQMHRHLLDHYASVGAKHIHYAVSFLKRVCCCQVTQPEKDEEPRTLEPLLYNVHVLGLCATVLNDPVARSSEHAELVDFAR